MLFYCQIKEKMILDKWQQELLEYEGNICAACGRQVGKSTVVAIKAAEYAVHNEKKSILVISAVERQAELLFEKILACLYDNYKSYIKKGLMKPTKHRAALTNGSVIYCLPCGLSGVGIRGYTIDLLIVDEAAFVPDDVFAAITPALLTTKANIILLGTPHGRQGYFYRSFQDTNFKAFHIASWDCPRANKEFLEFEKGRMTKMQYLQEYGGQFIESLFQFFSNDLIRKVMLLDRFPRPLFPIEELFLGVDIARMGEDESVLIAVCRQNREKIIQIDMEITKKTYLTETIERIKASDRKYMFKKIYIDSSGVGAGVYDVLLQDDQTKRKIVSIENAKKSLDRDETQSKRLMKEDLYANLLWLMENSKIELFNEPEIYLSLSSVQFEYTDSGDIKIFGNYTHIVEALVRACWAIKDKHLNIWVR
jgi:hypothetical protein